MGALDPEFERILKAALGEVSQGDFGSLTTERVISELGLDSVTLLELLGIVEDELGVRFDTGDLRRVRTFGDLWRLASRQRSFP